MIEIRVAPTPTQLRNVRREVRKSFERAPLTASHVDAIEAVANELLGAAFEGGTRRGVLLSIETFALLTSVRVRCPTKVNLRDEPFSMRDRVLGGFAFAWGRRLNGDGSVDLWAELARTE